MEEQIPHSGSGEWAMVQTRFFRVEEGDVKSEPVFLFVGSLGRPFPPLFFFPFLSPSVRPHLLRARWQHEEPEIMNTTTLTHRPHSTRVYYHTTIFQPNTVNGGSKGSKRGGREGAKGERGVGEEEEEDDEK